MITGDLPELSSPSEVLAVLAGLSPGAHVATDADNTLWSGDVGDELVRVAGTPPFAPWQPGQVALDWYRSAAETDFAGGCRYAARILQHVTTASVEPVLEAALRERVRPRRWLVLALQAAMARGVQVTIVSASPRWTVELGARLYGLSSCPIIAVDTDPGQPDVVLEPAPIGHGKVEAWQQRGLPTPDVALGDSRWDLPLLRSAKLGLLLQRACEDPHCDVEHVLAG
jgi:phosphoserine phosphatase